jgi:hypothetical protein
MKPVKLKIQPDFSLTVLGIISAENDLKLTWLINRLLNICLSKSVILNKQVIKTNQTQEFSLFQFEDEIQVLRYSLLKNKVKQLSYFEEFKNIDYILIIRGEMNESQKNNIYQKIKSSNEISSLIAIDTFLFKNQEKLEIF